MLWAVLELLQAHWDDDLLQFAIQLADTLIEWAQGKLGSQGQDCKDSNLVFKLTENIARDFRIA